MSVRQTPGVAILSGRCGVEDAEVLQRLLSANPEATVECTACEHLHAAVLQVLLVAKPRVRGSPSGAFVRTHLWPLVGGRAG
jgi:hypothetical protein